MTNHQFILDENKNPVRCDDIIEWGKWFQTADRVIKKTKVGENTVSTVFLGMDHNYEPDGKPLLYETIIFPAADYLERYATKEEAEAGHQKAVESLK